MRGDGIVAQRGLGYSNPDVVAYVARLTQVKRPDRMVDVARALPQVTFVVAGDGPLRASLEALAQARGVVDRVHFLGNVHNQDITPYYFAADLYVLPSIARSEAFAIVQLEAMASGLPVINTALDSGVPFVSRDGESGLTVPPRNPGALAAAVNRLLADPALRRRMGEAGKRRVAAEFSKERMTRRVLELYHRAENVRG